MNARIVYSSRTGNTRKLAEHAAARFGMPVHALSDAASIPAGTPLVLGFWLRRSAPNDAMAEFMLGLAPCRVFCFCTMTGDPAGAQAQRCLAKTKEMLESRGCTLAGSFFCRGSLDQAVLRTSPHAMTPERAARIALSDGHPDAGDAAAFEAALQKALPLLG